MKKMVVSFIMFLLLINLGGSQNKNQNVFNWLIIKGVNKIIFQNNKEEFLFLERNKIDESVLFNVENYDLLENLKIIGKDVYSEDQSFLKYIKDKSKRFNVPVFEFIKSKLTENIIDKNIICFDYPGIDSINQDELHTKTKDLYSYIKDKYVDEINKEDNLELFKKKMKEIYSLTPSIGKPTLKRDTKTNDKEEYKTFSLESKFSSRLNTFLHSKILRIIELSLVLLLLLYLIFILILRILTKLEIEPKIIVFESSEDSHIRELNITNKSLFPVQIKNIKSEKILYIMDTLKNRKIGKNENKITTIKICQSQLRYDRKIAEYKDSKGITYVGSTLLYLQSKCFVKSIRFLNIFIPLKRISQKIDLIGISKRFQDYKADSSDKFTQIDSEVIEIKEDLGEKEPELYFPPEIYSIIQKNYDVTQKIHNLIEKNIKQEEQEIYQKQIVELREKLRRISVPEEVKVNTEIQETYDKLSLLRGHIQSIVKEIKKENIKLDKLDEIEYQLDNFINYTEHLLNIKIKGLNRKIERIKQEIDLKNNPLEIAGKITEIDVIYKNIGGFRKKVDWLNEKRYENIKNTFLNRLRESLIINFIEEVDNKLNGINKNINIENSLKGIIELLELQEIKPESGEKLDKSECDVINKEAIERRKSLDIRIKEVKARGIKIKGNLKLKAKVLIDEG